MALKITDLAARFMNDSDGNVGVGVEMDCPCGSHCCLPLYVPFAVALDGKPTAHGDRGWQRSGDTLETLTLTPSVQRLPRAGETCAWHGYITNGEARNV
jgi:hypothetical protein